MIFLFDFVAGKLEQIGTVRPPAEPDFDFETNLPSLKVVVGQRR